MIFKDLKSKKILFIILTSIIFYWIVFHIEIVKKTMSQAISILSPFIFGILVAFILNILINIFENKIFKYSKKAKLYNKIRRPLSLLFAVILLLGSVVILAFFLLPMVFSSFQEAAAFIPKAFNSLQKWINELSDKYPMVNDSFKNLNIDFGSLQIKAITFLREQIPSALSFTANITTSIFNIVLNFVIGFIFSLYLVIQKEQILNYINKGMFAICGPKVSSNVQYVMNLIYKSFSGFISGQVIESIVLGILFYIGMRILSIPQALTVGFVQGVAALIPMFGAIIGTGIGFLIVLIVEPTKAIMFVIFSIVLIQIDANLIYPRIMGNSVGTPAILILMSVSIFGTVFGILGMIFAVPITNVIYTIINNYINQKLIIRSKQQIEVYNDKV